MRLYNINEVFGPVKCEIMVKGNDKCGKEAWTFILSKYEDSILLRKSGPEATTQIFQESLGVAICPHHLDLLFERKKKADKSSFAIPPNTTLSDTVIKDALQIKEKERRTLKEKVINNLFHRQCSCGRQLKFTDEGLKATGMDGLVLVHGAMTITCVCHQPMSASFSFYLKPEEEKVEVMRIDADGIGTLGVTTPSTKLHVRDDRNAPF